MFALATFNASAFDRFVQDPLSGFTLYGYDPVAYFERNDAVKGTNGIEVEWNGSYWKFRNKANRERFEEAPDAYVPLYNGYGAMALAEGRLTEGNPLIWIIYKNRVVLFHSAEARKAWLLNPPLNLHAGGENWDVLKLNLTAP